MVSIFLMQEMQFQRLRKVKTSLRKLLTYHPPYNIFLYIVKQREKYPKKTPKVVFINVIITISF